MKQKRPLHHNTAISALVITLLAAGCGGDGAAPVLSNLSLSSTTLTVGTQQNLNGSFNFEDVDADVFEIHAEITLPSGVAQTLPVTPFASAGGLATGQGALLLAIVPPESGQYTVRVWLRDEGGNDSNSMEVILNAS